MCAQCAIVALTAIGAAGVFRHQVQARIDLAPGAPPGGIETSKPLRTPPPLLLLLIIAALADHRHGAADFAELLPRGGNYSATRELANS